MKSVYIERSFLCCLAALVAVSAPVFWVSMVIAFLIGGWIATW